MEKKKFNLENVIISIFFVVLLIYALSILCLFLWGLINSFKSDAEFSGLIGSPDVVGLPDWKYSSEEIKFGNYIKILGQTIPTRTVSFWSGSEKIVHTSNNPSFFIMVLNTIIFAGVGSLLLTMVPFFVAYASAKYDYFYSKVLHTIVIIVMVIPLVGNQASEISLLRRLNLYDTWLGFFIQRVNFLGMYFLVFHSFFKGLSNTYIEAAEIDGAGQYNILFSIIIPLSVKMITSVYLILFVHAWNNYQIPMLYLPTLPTLAYGIYELAYLSEGGTTLNERLAACMFLAVPLLILFICFQKKLMGNVSMGGIKE